MTLRLSQHQLATIHAHAERTYPHECCGLLLGKLDGAIKVVETIRVVVNAWDEAVAHELADEPTLTQTRRYWIDPSDMLAAMRAARQHNLEIIGIYHSHPDNPAVPSECDRRLAWSQYSYLIASVQQGSTTETLSWTLDDTHQFQPEPIEIATLSRM